MGTHPIFESDFDCLTELVMKKILALGLIQVTFCINFFEIANSTALFSDNDIAELILPEFNIFPSACNFIAYQMRFGEACHERIQSGLKFKDHQKAEQVIRLIHDANFLLKTINRPKTDLKNMLSSKAKESLGKVDALPFKDAFGYR